MRLIHILIAVLAISCISKQTRPNAGPVDSAVVSSEARTDTSDDFVQPDLTEIRKDFINGYSVPTVIDTSYSFNHKNNRVILKHYCTWDSSVVIPAKYDFDTRRDFLTHNFQSDLILITEGDTVFTKTIRKEDFDSLLYPELKSYAVLSDPYVEFKSDSTYIHYSISIPVTDVGIGATIIFDHKGNHYTTR